MSNVEPIVKLIPDNDRLDTDLQANKLAIDLVESSSSGVEVASSTLTTNSDNNTNNSETHFNVTSDSDSNQLQSQPITQDSLDYEPTSCGAIVSKPDSKTMTSITVTRHHKGASSVASSGRGAGASLSRQTSALSHASSTLSMASSVHDFCPFSMGEQVYVDGQRSGVIKFIGETKFGGAGLWVGIELDSEIGKNDGSVDGVHYFECSKPMHGIFVRPVRLHAQSCCLPPLSNGQQVIAEGGAVSQRGLATSNIVGASLSRQTSGVGSQLHGKTTPLSQAGALRRARSTLHESSGATTNRLGTNFRVPLAPSSSSSLLNGSTGSSHSNQRLLKASSSLSKHQISQGAHSSSGVSTSRSQSSTSSSSSSSVGLRVGQRVLVTSQSGLKTGILRFVGPTEFTANSSEIYAGVELDEPSGKNDGTVAGKLYFTCRPLFGLFAPIAKVQRLTPALERQFNLKDAPSSNNNNKSANTSGNNNSNRSGQHRASPALVVRSVSSLASTAGSASRESLVSSISSVSSASNSKARRHEALCLTSVADSLVPRKAQHNTIIAAHANLAHTAPIGGGPTAAAAAAAAGTALNVNSRATANVNKQFDAMNSATDLNNTTNGQLMALADKDAQIELLTRERNEQRRDNHELHERLAQLEQRLMQSELEKSRMSSEAEDEIAELKRLSSELEDETRKLSDRLDNERNAHDESQFKADELEAQRADYEQQVRTLTEQLQQALQLQQHQKANTENTSFAGDNGGSKIERSATIKAKYEKEVAALKEQVICRDEQLMQLRTSLEMRKQEVKQLQQRVVDVERACKLETERNERHLAKLDDINLELKAAEARALAKAEEAEMHEKQVRQLRHDLRCNEQQVEQLMLAAKKKQQAAASQRSRVGATTPTSPIVGNATSGSATPTQDEAIVRYQMEVRDLKDELIDREAECDCMRREMDLLKHKLETRSLEVDTNNQELARRCQDLLESNRQSDDTIKQLMKSNTEYSQQLIRATQDLKEANAKCGKLRDEIADLERQLSDQMTKVSTLNKQNCELRSESDDARDQLESMRSQADEQAKQLEQLRQQLDEAQSSVNDTSDKFIARLSEAEKENSTLRHEAQQVRHDLRTAKQQVNELQGERDRCKAELTVRDKYVESRDAVIDELKRELQVARANYDELSAKAAASNAASTPTDADMTEQLQVAEKRTKEARAQVDALRHELEQMEAQNATLCTQLEQHERACQEHQEARAEVQSECARMRAQFEQAVSEARAKSEQIERMQKELESSALAVHDKYREERNDLLNKIGELERQIAEHQQQQQQYRAQQQMDTHVSTGQNGTQVSAKFSSSTTPEPVHGVTLATNEREELESQIEFLNSVIVDMQKECDELKSRCSTLEDMATLGKMSLSGKQSAMGGNNGHNNNNHGLKHNVRAYCDICERFDAHNTHECPKRKPASSVRFGTIGAPGGAVESAAAFAQKLSLDDDALLDYYKEPTSNSYFQSLRRPPVRH